MKYRRVLISLLARCLAIIALYSFLFAVPVWYYVKGQLPLGDLLAIVSIVAGLITAISQHEGGKPMISLGLADCSIGVPALPDPLFCPYAKPGIIYNSGEWCIVAVNTSRTSLYDVRVLGLIGKKKTWRHRQSWGVDIPPQNKRVIARAPSRKFLEDKTIIAQYRKTPGGKPTTILARIHGDKTTLVTTETPPTPIKAAKNLLLLAKIIQN